MQHARGVQTRQREAPFDLDGEAVQRSTESSLEAPAQSPGTEASQVGIRSNPAAAAPLFSHLATEAAPPVQMQRQERLPEGEKGFERMWAAHPHNYLPDESQNTSSEQLLEDQGLPAWISNTCAVRLSVMLNQMGLTITPAKTRAAGIQRAPMYSRKTGQYYILAASEMWTYLARNFRKADQLFPATGLYKDANSFQEAFDKEIKPIVSARKGIVAFETIFGYSGTGHVDIFDGETLSDAPSWYPCKRLHLWYVVVP